MKIAFTGASGTGKTTLAKFLAAELGIPFNPVGSRSTVKSMGFENPYDVDKASLDVYLEASELVSPDQAARLALAGWAPGMKPVRPLFQAELQLAKIVWENKHEHFVTDRTPICDLSYLCLHGHKHVDDTFIQMALNHTENYTHIFWTPLLRGQWHGGDPARLKAAGAYHDIHEVLIRGWFGRVVIPVVEIDQEDLLERKRDVLREVSGTNRANAWWADQPNIPLS